jgi:hypothetical protein
MVRQLACRSAAWVLGVSLVAPAAAQGDARLDAASSAQEVIAAALEAKVSLDFQETPLQQIATEIGKSHKINVVIDAKSLSDAGVAPDTALSVHVADVTLRSALDVLLFQADLTFVVRNEVLLIVTNDKASTELTTKSHNVADLVTLDEHAGVEDSDDEDADDEDCAGDVFEDLVVTTIAPSTWDKVGGPGSISAFGNCRVISQTDEVHRQIDNLLAALRKLKNPPDRSSGEPIWAIDPAELGPRRKSKRRWRTRPILSSRKCRSPILRPCLRIKNIFPCILTSRRLARPVLLPTPPWL